jgi:hypothetical protein
VSSNSATSFPTQVETAAQIQTTDGGQGNNTNEALFPETPSAEIVAMLLSKPKRVDRVDLSRRNRRNSAPSVVTYKSKDLKELSMSSSQAGPSDVIPVVSLN